MALESFEIFFSGEHSSALRISLHLKLCKASSDGISDGILNNNIGKCYFLVLTGKIRPEFKDSRACLNSCMFCPTATATVHTRSVWMG